MFEMVQNYQVMFQIEELSTNFYFPQHHHSPCFGTSLKIGFKPLSPSITTGEKERERFNLVWY